MLTIDIPKSNARESEEDAFAKYILEGIKKDGEKRFLWFGSGWGSGWEDGYSDKAGETMTRCSRLAIYNVVKQFERNGYSIQYGEIIAAGKYVTIKG